MKLNKRNTIQLSVSILVIVICIVYFLYINDYIEFRILSVGDLNPYGGWSAIKSSVTDLSYRFRGFTKGIALTAAISITAFFMGRFFCGYICPIGAMQDFFKFLGTKLNIKEIHIKKCMHYLEKIKYFILIAVIGLSIFHMGKLISPFSPWLSYLNFFMGNINESILVLIVIIIASLFFKRLFCRVFCPLGAFQSLLYAVGPFKVKKKDSCLCCTNCFKDCPVEMDNKDEVISPECISCSQCTTSICIKGNKPYSYTIFNKPIKNYVSICLLLFLSIYILLPMLPHTTQAFPGNKELSFKDGSFKGVGIGFGGNIEIELNVEDNKINDIKVITHNETEGYFEEVFKVLDDNIKSTQSLNVDVISGATATSRGYVNAVRDALIKSLYDEGTQ